MSVNHILSLLFLLFVFQVHAQQKKEVLIQSVYDKPVKTIITGVVPDTVKELTIQVIDYSKHSSLYILDEPDNTDTITHRVTKGQFMPNGFLGPNFHFEISIKNPVYINFTNYTVASSSSLGGFWLPGVLVEPGDSINLDLTRGKGFGEIEISGRGAAKFQCCQAIEKILLDLYGDPYIGIGISRRLQLSWTDSIIATANKVIDFYKNKLSSTAISIIKVDLVLDAIFDISEIINGVPGVMEGMNIHSAAVKKLYKERIPVSRKIFDPGDPALAYCSDRIISRGIVMNRAMLNYAMDEGIKYPSLRKFKKEYYEAMEKYIPEGPLKLRTIARGLTFAATRAFTPEVEVAMQKFISKNNITNFSRQVVEEYHETFKNRMSKDSSAYPFVLRDTTGKIIKMEDFKGKVVLFDFMFTGCTGCKFMREYLPKVEEKFKDNKGFVVVSISVTKELEGPFGVKAGAGIYNTPGSIQLYTNGEGYKHTIISYYKISAYPTLVLIGKEGKIVSARPPDPRLDNGKALTELIKQTLEGNEN